MKKMTLFLTVFVSICFFSSCKKETEPSNTFKGPTVSLGDGFARSWIRINQQGMPEEIGAEITEAAMQSLPSDFQGLVLPLHHKAMEVTPFKHVGLDYQPHGHHPPGVFDIPHFDAHFYLITLEERMSIPTPTQPQYPFFRKRHLMGICLLLTT